MNRILFVMCMALCLVFHVSCQDNVVNSDLCVEDLQLNGAEEKVQLLVEKARMGDTEAYLALAQCYCEGDGVAKSWMNMMSVYACYAQRTGAEFEDVLMFIEEGHPFRVLIELVEFHSSDEECSTKLNQIKQLLPAEAVVVELMEDGVGMGDSSILSVLREAENNGSELAMLLQAMYYEDNDDAEYEDCLMRNATKYPLLYIMLAEHSTRKYQSSNNLSDIQQAVNYYYKADEYGMLTRKSAIVLLNIYERFKETGGLEINEQEMKRLNDIATKIK